MKHIVLGTSGHIDHGKTSLIKCLTGFDTDTLEEEKRRGITINNGYTNLKIDDELNIGVIDVPGHEKFIKNMVAGVSSIDLVLFVIGADDGIMPQTKEHFSILKTLGVKNGIIVLTKVDLVDDEWINFIIDEIKEFTKGSFLENAKIVKFSSKTGEGLDILKSEIKNISKNIEEKDREALFRMGIDRVFTIKGFGTVVTGTVLGGRVSIGDNLELYPGKMKCKVRGIQIHGVDKIIGEAGERCAINLTGIEKEDVKRGLILGEVNREVSSYIIDAKIYLSDYIEKNIVNRQRIRLNHGTKEVIGRIILLDRDELKKGEEAYCQIRLEEEISSRSGDKIVIRNYSPIETLGGGSVLDAKANKCKRFKEEYIENLKIKESGSLNKKIENLLKDLNTIVSLNDIKNEINKEEEVILDSLKELEEEKRIISLDNMYIHNRFLLDKSEELVQLLNKFHLENSLKIGMKKEEIKSKIFNKKIKKVYFEELLALMEKRNYIKIQNNYVSTYNFVVKLNLAQKNMKNELLNYFLEDGFKTRKLKEILDKQRDRKLCLSIFEYLKEGGELIELSEEVIYTKVYLDKALEEVKKFLEKNTYINLSDLKEILNIPRKYLIAILEYSDKILLTERTEEGRKLLE